MSSAVADQGSPDLNRASLANGNTLGTGNLNGSDIPRAPVANRNVFTLMGIFNSVYLVQEVIEPVLRLVLELLTALLLGITFCVQSVSVMISFDSVVSGIFKSISRTVATVISLVTNYLLNSESERKAVSHTFVNYYANIMWTYIAYRINYEIYHQFFFFPMILMSLLTIICQVYMTRNEIAIEPSPGNVRLLSSVLVVLGAVVYAQSQAVSWKSLPVMLLLMKVPINTLYSGLGLLFRLSLALDGDENETGNSPEGFPVHNNGNLSPGNNHNSVSDDENLYIYVIEIMRSILWTLISAYEYSLCFHRFPLPQQLPATALSSVSDVSAVIHNSSTLANVTTTILSLINETLVNATGQSGLSSKNWQDVVEAATAASFISAARNSNTSAASISASLASSSHYHARKDRWFYLLLLFHDLIHLTIPVKKLLLKFVKDAFIQQQFPHVTAEELQGLSADDRCSICLCEHNLQTVRLPCSHLLHQQCLNRILQDLRSSRCPICRAEIMPVATGGNGRTGDGNNNLQEFIIGTGSPGGGGGGRDHGPGGGYEFRDVIRVRILTPSVRVGPLINRLSGHPTVTGLATNQPGPQPSFTQRSHPNNFTSTSSGVSSNPPSIPNPIQSRTNAADRVSFRTIFNTNNSHSADVSSTDTSVNHQPPAAQYIRLNLRNLQRSLRENSSGPTNQNNADTGDINSHSAPPDYANLSLDDFFQQVIREVEQHSTSTQSENAMSDNVLNNNSNSINIPGSRQEFPEPSQSREGDSSLTAPENIESVMEVVPPREAVSPLREEGTSSASKDVTETIRQSPESCTSGEKNPEEAIDPLIASTASNDSSRVRRKRSLPTDSSSNTVPISAPKRRKSVRRPPSSETENVSNSSNTSASKIITNTSIEKARQESKKRKAEEMQTNLNNNTSEKDN